MSHSALDDPKSCRFCKSVTKEVRIEFDSTGRTFYKWPCAQCGHLNTTVMPETKPKKGAY